jgi:hypothetical protein
MPVRQVRRDGAGRRRRAQGQHPIRLAWRCRLQAARHDVDVAMTVDATIVSRQLPRARLLPAELPQGATQMPGRWPEPIPVAHMDQTPRSADQRHRERGWLVDQQVGHPAIDHPPEIIDHRRRHHPAEEWRVLSCRPLTKPPGQRCR